LGSFIANVQVRTQDIDAVARALSAGLLEADQYTPTTGDDAARSLALIQRGDWVAVYDELLDEQDLRVLDATASLLSRETGAPAVGVLVHDSDVLLLRLYRDGALADQHNNNPEFFDLPRRSAAGRAQHWKDLLAPGSRASDLRTAWRGKAPEDALGEVARHLGIDQSLIRFCHQDLVEDVPVRRLRFKRAPLSPEEAALLQLRVEPRSIEGQVWIGEPIDATQVFLCNGPVSRLRVELGGSALTNGCVTADDTVRVHAADPTAPTAARIGSMSLKSGVIPARLLPPPGPVERPQEPRLCFSLSPRLSAFVPGEGEVWLRVTPEENPDGGAEARLRLQVTAPPLLPFPAGATVNHGHALRKLYDSRFLALLMVIEGAPPDAIKPLLEAWPDGFSIMSLDDELTQLGLWTEPQQNDDDKAALRRLASAVAAEERLVQAVLARQGWKPDGGPARTPYEEITAPGAAVGGASAERWLRTIGEEIWLGPSLQRWLGDTGPVEKVAQVEWIPGALHLRLDGPTDPAALGRLEAALSSVTPFPKDRI
jgi:hypothetical protein